MESNLNLSTWQNRLNIRFSEGLLSLLSWSQICYLMLNFNLKENTNVRIAEGLSVLFSNCYEQNFLLVHRSDFHKDNIRGQDRECFTWRKLMAFQKFDLLSVCAKGLLKPSWLQSHQRPFWPTELLCTVYCWKLLSDASRLKSCIQVAEELHVAFQPQVLDPGLSN